MSQGVVVLFGAVVLFVTPNGTGPFGFGGPAWLDMAVVGGWFLGMTASLLLGGVCVVKLLRYNRALRCAASAGELRRRFSVEAPHLAPALPCPRRGGGVLFLALILNRQLVTW